MIKITYFVHCTSIHNKKGIAAGWKGSRLTRKGKKQAKKLGELVCDKIFNVIFCSDLNRAVETANLAFSENYFIIQDKRLREINFGEETNLRTSVLIPKQVYYIDKPFPSGESYKDVEVRITDFLNFLRVNYQNNHIGIVAHQAPQLALEVLLNNKTWVQAFHDDWRAKGEWQPGWEYLVP
ncbi:MAG: histidine phosphatase family protein [Candidatus Hodarchaeota archaeon]